MHCLRHLLLPALLLSLTMPLAAASAAGCDSGQVSVHCGDAPSATMDYKGRLWVAFVQVLAEKLWPPSLDTA